LSILGKAAQLRRILQAVIVASLLSSLFVFAFDIQPAKTEQGTIYIRADGKVEGTAYIRTSDNITYVFYADIINDSIIVQRDNIVIDGNGHVLQGPGNGRAIDLSQRTNVTIKHIQVNGFWFGIYFNSSSSNSIGGNNIANNVHGVYLNSSSNNNARGNNMTNNDECIDLYASSSNNISGNNISGNSMDGIYLYSSSSNSISGNNIANNAYGMFLYASSSNSISGNNMTNNSWGVDLYASSSNSISGNNMTNNSWGVDLYASSSNSISGNRFTDCGLSVWDSYENSVENNIVNGRPLVYLEGIEDYAVGDAGQVILVGCDTIRVENLDLSRASYGVQLWETTDSVVSYNNITANNFEGIMLDYSSHNSINENNVTTNDAGIYLCSSSNNSISGNNIENNAHGIFLTRSSKYNIIGGNNITANNDVGIDLCISSSNSIYHNNFIGNKRQVYDFSWDYPEDSPSINVWDDGYPSGGNYWSDYAGVDLKSGPYQNVTGSDGIGDTQYVIDSGNKDRYPLMTPWTPLDFSISVSSSVFWINRGESATCTITLTSLGDFSSLISLNALVNPSTNNVTLKLEPTSISLTAGASAQSTMTISTSSTAPLETFTITVSAEGGAKVHSTTVTIYVITILNVPYQYQYGTGWCGPTSLAMVLRYYGVATHCWNVAEYLNLGRSDPAPLSDNRGSGLNLAPKLSYYLDRYYPQYMVQYYLHDLTSQVFTDIESNVSQGRPVILCIKNPSNAQDQHCIVITGYNETGFFFNDPSGLASIYAPSYVTPFKYGAGIHGYVTKEGIASHDFDLICANFTDRFGLTENTGTLLILKGVPSPTLGSLELVTYPSDHSINSALSSVYFDRPWPNLRIFLDLDRGLMWKEDLLGNGVPTGCPILGPEDTMKCHIEIYNHEAQSQALTIAFTVTGEDGLTYNSILEVKNVESLGQESFLQTIPLGNYLTKTQYYHIKATLFDSNGNEIDTISIPDIYYFASGTSIKLQESQHHLFLQVYDSQSRHVGLNYTSNETEIEVPYAYYFDNSNGTITVILSMYNSSCRVIVDATFAQQTTESYNLTIITVNTAQTIDQNITQATIQEGTQNQYNIEISQDGKIISVTPVPEFQPLMLLPLFMMITLLWTMIFKKKRTVRSKQLA